METVSTLPSSKAIIGTKVVSKNIRKGVVKNVIVAENCPEEIVRKIKNAGNVAVKKFEGDEKDLGTKLGKPFPIAVVGYPEK